MDKNWQNDPRLADMDKVNWKCFRILQNREQAKRLRYAPFSDGCSFPGKRKRA